MAPNNLQKTDEQESKEPCGQSIGLTAPGSVYTSLIAVNGLDYSQDIATLKSLNCQLVQSSNSSLKVNVDLTHMSPSNRAKPKLPSGPSSHHDPAQDLRFIGGWIQQDLSNSESKTEKVPRN